MEIEKVDPQELKFNIVNTKQFVAGSSSAVDVDHLAMLVYSEEGMKQNEIQDKGASGYGYFNTTLSEGTHDVLFVGYYKDSTLVTDQGIHALSFGGGYVPNTFVNYKRVLVQENGSKEESVILRHVCACFSLQCNDGEEMPNLASMEVTVHGGYNVLDGTTGYASAQSVDRVTKYAISSAQIVAGSKLSVYTYLPSDTAALDISVCALDASGNVLKNRDFKNVPLQISHKSIYSGNFMSDEDPDKQDEEVKVNYGWTISIEDAGWTEDNYNF